MHPSPTTPTLLSLMPAPLAKGGLIIAVGAMTLFLAGCAKERAVADSSAVSAQPSNQTAGMGDMKGMPMGGNGDTSGMKGMGHDSAAMGGMKGMGGMTGMMGDMQKQMDAMMKVSPDQMKAMMPAHRQMAANALGEMTAEMRKMNMSGDAAWTATVDSVRQDLARMPDLNGKEMTATMPAHHARMMRLMAMHQAMMKNMKM